MTWQPVNLSETCPANSNLTTCTPFGYIYLNLLVQLYGGSRVNRAGEETSTDGSNNVYDFIVIGAGSAGCIVANRLSAVKEWRVLVVEAGMEQPDVSLVPGFSTSLLGSNIDWSYQTEPDGMSCLGYPEGRCRWPRGKVMGGSSTINSFVYIRGNKVDYDGWAAMGNDGWSYDDVLPYFKKSEQNLNIEITDPEYHGYTGEQYISLLPYIDEPSLLLLTAFHQKGLPFTDFNGYNQTGTAQAQTITRQGVRISANTAFIQPVRHIRSNLVIKTESEAVKILINDEKKAYGVQYINKDQLYTAYATKEVVVSAGAINSPKLLLMSGIGPEEHLKEAQINLVQDLPVGENLHDHITVNGIVIALSDEVATRVSRGEVLKQAYDHMESKTGPLSGNGPISSLAFFRTDPELVAPDIEVQVNDVTDWREFIRDPVNYDKVALLPTAFYNGLVPRAATLIKHGRGRVILNVTDPNGPPLIYPNYFGDVRDLELLIKGLKFLLSLQDTDPFKSGRASFVKIPLPACKDYIWGTDEFLLCMAKSYTNSAYHPVGTCKMGPTGDKTAVVDPKLRVQGVSSLRVIDASIMPNITKGNTNAPALMIGERGVAFILEDYGYGENVEDC